MTQNAGERFGIHAAGQRVSGEGVPEIVGEVLTDVFGEELRSWEENGKMEKELSA